MLVTDETESRRILVSEFVELARSRLELHVHSANDTLQNHFLNSPRVQKLGMALSGFADKVHRGRIQIFGNSERSYLDRLGPIDAAAAFGRLDRENISCILVTARAEPGGDVIGFADLHGIPLLSTALPSSEATSAVNETLSVALAPTSTLHGVMMEVFGIGVLIIGESAIGKSECALDLISRGHRLVSDDAVRLKRVGDELSGEAPESIRDFLEIRGLGIINARELFGVSSIADSGTVRLCIDFTSREVSNNEDRLGIEEASIELLGVPIRRFPIPVTPGRNLATLVEAAVRVFVSRKSGPHAVEELITKHRNALSANNRN